MMDQSPLENLHEVVAQQSKLQSHFCEFFKITSIKLLKEHTISMLEWFYSKDVSQYIFLQHNTCTSFLVNSNIKMCNINISLVYYYASIYNEPMTSLWMNKIFTYNIKMYKAYLLPILWGYGMDDRVLSFVKWI